MCVCICTSVSICTCVWGRVEHNTCESVCPCINVPMISVSLELLQYGYSQFGIFSLNAHIPLAVTNS